MMPLASLIDPIPARSPAAQYHEACDLSCTVDSLPTACDVGSDNNRDRSG